MNVIPYAKLIGGIILAVLVAVAGFYVYSLKSERDDLLTEKGRYVAMLDESQEATRKAMEHIDAVTQRVQENSEKLTGLLEQQRKASQQLRRIDDVFAKHNLEALLEAHPGMVTDSVNSGTRATLRMLECASGGDCGGGPTQPSSSSGSP